MNQDNEWKKEFKKWYLEPYPASWKAHMVVEKIESLLTQEYERGRKDERGNPLFITDDKGTINITETVKQARAEERKKVIAEIRASVKKMIYLKGYQENERQMKLREVGFEKAKRQFMRILSLSPVEESQPKNET